MPPRPMLDEGAILARQRARIAKWDAEHDALPASMTSDEYHRWNEAQRKDANAEELAATEGMTADDYHAYLDIARIPWLERALRMPKDLTNENATKVAQAINRLADAIMAPRTRTGTLTTADGPATVWVEETRRVATDTGGTLALVTAAAKLHVVLDAPIHRTGSIKTGDSTERMHLDLPGASRLAVDVTK